jgi:hypothetical protein
MSLENLTESLRQIGKRLLNQAEASVWAQGVIPECMMCESKDGLAADAILTQARQWESNLVVMGSPAQSAGAA